MRWTDIRLSISRDGKRSLRGDREEAEVLEKRAMVRFALSTALRDRQATSREVRIVLESDARMTMKMRSRSGRGVDIARTDRILA